MNNTQFFVAIGVPTASFLLIFMASTVINRNAIVDLRGMMQAGLGSNRTAIDDLRSEMRDGLANLRAEMTGGAASLRAEMTSGFAAVNLRVDDLRSEVTTGFAGVNLRVEDLSARVGRVEARLDTIDNELRIGHERRISTLEAQVLGRAS